MKINKLVYCVLLAPLLAYSCTPYVNIVSVDTLVPPPYEVELANKKVAIIGNLIANPLAEEGESRYLYDSVLIAKVTEGVKLALEETPLFEGLSIPIYYCYSQASSLPVKLMTTTELDSLAKSIDANALISVEYTSIESQGLGEKFGNHYISYIETSYQCLFRLYDATLGQLASQVLIKSDSPETISYLNTNGTPALITADMAKQAFATQMGVDYAKRIAPYWESVERVYYVGPDDSRGNLNAADRYAQNQQWQEAITYWDRALSSSKKTVAAMAAFNLALGCEMLGNLDLAKQWLEQCKKMGTKINPDDYMEVIVTRIEDKKKLDKHMRAL